MRSVAINGPARSRVIETHISWVILTGKFAYKIKKPVNLGFLDFSTLAKRHQACLQELRLNRRLTPDLYIDVVAIYGSAEAPTFDARGPIIEYAVRMRRFPENSVVVETLAQRPPTLTEIGELASLVAKFHLTLVPAAAGETWGRLPGIGGPVDASIAQLRDLLPDGANRRRLESIDRFLHHELPQISGLIEARRLGGFVRECHGDLHLGNLVRIGDRLLPFDALEFDPALRWIDVLSEVAFLVMDLDCHGYRDLAFEFLNRYLDITGDHDGLPVLPFYLGYRALVRAKVRALSPDAQDDPQRDAIATLLDYAADPLSGLQPILILMCGVSGSGKSWLARGLARSLPAVHLRSDIERKRLFGLDPLDRTGAAVGEGIYHPEASGRTYDRLGLLAAAALRAGLPVIVDATNLRREHRAPFSAIAHSAACPVAILVCDADVDLIAERVQRRLATGLDPSEAGAEVVSRQQHEFERPLPAEGDLVTTCDSANPVAVPELAERLRALGHP